MLKVGTHNSITGESGKGLKDILLTPFACCQSKTIREQLDSGVRYFDIRVKQNKKSEWVGCHGLWTSDRAIPDVLDEIYLWLVQNNSKAYVMITFEGKSSDIDARLFITEVHAWFKEYVAEFLELTSINIKKPYGTRLYTNSQAPYLRHRYLGLGGATWHTYLPIPWLWKKLYFNKPDLIDSGYTLVDFW